MLSTLTTRKTVRRMFLDQHGASALDREVCPPPPCSEHRGACTQSPNTLTYILLATSRVTSLPGKPLTRGMRPKQGDQRPRDGYIYISVHTYVYIYLCIHTRTHTHRHTYI